MEVQFLHSMIQSCTVVLPRATNPSTTAQMISFRARSSSTFEGTAVAARTVKDPLREFFLEKLAAARGPRV